MPITRLLQPIRVSALALLLTGSLAVSAHAATPGVAVVRAASWSPGDTVREGAGELEVLICAAKLQREHPVAGIVGIGNRHGLFVQGAERALKYLAMSGVPVAKLARGGDLAPDPAEIFIDASGLTEEQASAILVRCLDRFGAPPRAANPEHPNTKEILAVQNHLRRFREVFSLEAAPHVALR